MIFVTNMYINIALERLAVYLKYYIKSGTIYDIHSPFLFELIQFCFDRNRIYYDFIHIDQFCRRVYSDHKPIPPSEFARQHGQLNLSIHQMAKKAAASISHAELLYRIGLYFKPNCILELGSCVGISAFSLGLSNKRSRIYSIEGNEFLSHYARKSCLDAGLDHIEFRNEIFASFLDNNDLSMIDLVYLDGDHKYEATLKYVRQLLNKLNDNAVIILDDIHWSKPMYNAWLEIQSWPECHCSLETPRLGFVFKSKNLSPGHFNFIPHVLKPWKLGLFS